MIRTYIYGDKCDKEEIETNEKGRRCRCNIPGWVTQKYPDEAIVLAVAEMSSTGAGFYRGLRAGGMKDEDLLETGEYFPIGGNTKMYATTCIIDKRYNNVLYAAQLITVQDE